MSVNYWCHSLEDCHNLASYMASDTISQMSQVAIHAGALQLTKRMADFLLSLSGC